MKIICISFILGAICVGIIDAKVAITVDTSKATDLEPFGKTVKNTLQDWFPRVVQILNSPNYKPIDSFNIFFDPKYGGVAEAGGRNIRGSVNYYREHKDDVGSMVHEMAHLIQAYKKCDGWVTEGIADWVRYYKYEPNRQPRKPSSSNNWKQGYGIAAYFLNYINKQYKEPSMIYWINKDCREGTYDESMFKRLTGKTVEQWWNEMLAKG